VDGDKICPRYQVGDLVKCWYYFYQYFYYPTYHNDDDDYTPFHGVIVDIDYAEYAHDYDDNIEILYIVFCTDGSYRFFTEDEVFKIC
jgi:hypothetical protein